jgi:hypothetical protein
VLWRWPVGAKYVPVASPARACPASLAVVTTVGMPAAVAIRAESTFVDMPPLPRPLAPVLPAFTLRRSRGPVTTSIFLASPLLGSPS